MVMLLIILPVKAKDETMQLLGRSKVNDYHVELTEADWRWLRNKSKLILGVSGPDYAPFEISVAGSELEGITADFVKLIGDLLHVKVEVRYFSSRMELIEALKSGVVDLLGTANGFEASDKNLILSHDYASDQSVLLALKDDSRSPELSGVRLAMFYHYLRPEFVRAIYPNAKLQLYSSNLSALAAVAFGQADAYIGDSISANYIVNNNYLDDVQVFDFANIEASAFSFALSKNNSRLLDILNEALRVIPISERMVILHRWGAGKSTSGSKLKLTSLEQRWLELNSRVRVLVNEDYIPLSYIDGESVYRGISSDVLAEISLRTGLKFDIQRIGSEYRVIEKIKTGAADLIVAFTQSVERAGALRFTRPYLTTPFVLVSKGNPESPDELDEMDGMSLALIRGSAPWNFISLNYPKINIVEASSAADSLDLVVQGKADAAINPLINARYMISESYRDCLKIKGAVGVGPAKVSFATDRGAIELHSIMDKALLSISPDEMEDIVNRWRGKVIIDDRYWLKRHSALIYGFWVSVLLLMGVLVFAVYLRKLIVRRDAAESTLMDRLEFMTVLLDGTPHPIYVRDRDGLLSHCNSSYLNFLSVNRDAVLGKTVVEAMLFEEHAALNYEREYLQVIDSGVPQIQDRLMHMVDGRKFVIYHWLLPYRDSEGVIVGLIGGWIDVSDREALLEQVETAKEFAESTNQAKSTFIATMSHEIRTPLNAVIGMLEMVMKKAEQGVLDRLAIEVASSSAQELMELIGDILDISRIESGRLSLSPQRANFRALIESSVRVFEGLVQEKKLQLVLELDPKVNVDVLIDSLRFRQVISNLLSNAIKFTAEGTICVVVEVLPSFEPHRLLVKLCVKDTGAGISASDQLRLFTPFTQAENNAQSPRSGAGLGLVISRTLCEMMGGSLHLTSILGTGTETTVELDLCVLEPIKASHAIGDYSTVQQPVFNVLVVDDYPANRLLLSQQLGCLGHQVTDAENGVVALQKWRDNSFDVVITDCNMPLMNGYQLARAIRDDELARDSQPCFIFAFTANAKSDEKERCLSAGMNDCLVKPIGLKELSDYFLLIDTTNKQGVSMDHTTEGICGIDLSGLHQLTRGDRDALVSLLAELKSCNYDDLVELARLSDRKNIDGLKCLAHKIKGGGRLVGANNLIAACELLELVCRNGVAEDEFVSAVTDLNDQMLRLSRELEDNLRRINNEIKSS